VLRGSTLTQGVASLHDFAKLPRAGRGAHLPEVLHEPVVQVLPPEVGVAGGGLQLERAVSDGHQGHVAAAPPQVEDQHGAVSRGACMQGVGVIMHSFGGGGVHGSCEALKKRDGDARGGCAEAVQHIGEGAGCKLRHNSSGGVHSRAAQRCSPAGGAAQSGRERRKGRECWDAGCRHDLPLAAGLHMRRWQHSQVLCSGHTVRC
jgi:hypothetical protein